MPAPTTPPIAVLTPTLRRPESLARALRSLAALDHRETLIAQVVVVDNDPDGGARDTVEALKAETGLPLLYVHAPRPGVATARNAGLEHVVAEHVAFLDDDEEAPPQWLERLYATHLRLNADATFGPVRGVAEGAPQAERAYLDSFFSRIGPAETGMTERGWGCGNSILRRATALPGPAPFDTAGDRTGGEDDRLFQALAAKGARFAWAADAWVWERAPQARANVRYALTRAFAYGQGPPRHALRHGRPLEAAGWMAVGAAQAALHGAHAAVAFALRRPERFHVADRCARGLGKVFWRTRTEFYGEAALAPPARRAPSWLRPSHRSAT
jgi:succinoglycan biosynthesis protein ExoM